jgi:hypothetical protein
MIQTLALAAAGLPPLTPAQVTRLETARDRASEYREEAFYALLENARLWTDAPGDAPLRLKVDVEAILSQPQRLRGELFGLRGAISQQMRLPPPHQDVHEWFLRDGDGRPLIVYVLLAPADARGLRDGSEVAVVARFYKSMVFEARDQVTRVYPAFVGALPRHTRAAAAGPSVGFLAMPLAALGAAFLLLLLYTRRQRRRGPRSGAAGPPVERFEAGGELPDDPAEALAELRRRASASPPP